MHYPWHPMYGREVQVLRPRPFYGEAHYAITLFDNSEVLIPTWMTDENYCRRLQLVEKPFVSVQALCALAELLKAVAR